MSYSDEAASPQLPAREVQKKSLTKLEKEERFWGWIMIMPLLAGLIVFYFTPFFQNVFYSFTDLGEFQIWTTISLDNYINLFSDDEFRSAIYNTLAYVFICVPIITVLSLLLAIGLNQAIRGQWLFRTLLFLPAVTMPAAIAMVWQWLMNRNFGLINQILAFFDLPAIGWLSDPDVVRLSASLVIIWSAIALKMIILLAGLQGIPKQIYEAMSLDGISKLRGFWSITLPLMIPTLFFVLVISFIETLQIFDVVYLLFGSSSMVDGQTMTIAYLFYKYAFIYHEKGYASAIAVVIFVITMVLTLLQIWIGKRLKAQ
ncbi:MULTISPECIES: carbohydrate ABC transporter permease [Citrobacter]|uniref:carbohydrate ABC transporter permease n=1 Tax=Citrobacter TaxID=544 RepID=UPI0010155C8A|nr:MULTISPECIES: sugar ABC transporter permease [Citrobacter]ELK7392395.1 sugar ABC transporter permease [Citrobacter freundii]MBE0004408.1 sugar ABC transporter permease [Citrobacter freundii]MDT7346232.1 sugar ABC transporter permease [Citrobacter freundii]MDT7446975.1 sugar ABC transporter permease [Citrobacter freundii]MEB7950159.1 sugar ABC transporter permease [Citrobacter freundii]